MNLLLILFAIIAVYCLIVTAIIFTSFKLTSYIKSKLVKSLIRTIIIILAPFWLYIDMAIGLPLLQLACTKDGGVKIIEPFDSDAFSVIEGHYLPKNEGSYSNYELKNLLFYFNSPWGLGKISSNHNIAIIQNYSNFHAKFRLAKVNDPLCIYIPNDLKKIFANLLTKNCIAVEFVDGIYAGYSLNPKPYRTSPRHDSTNNKHVGFGLTKLGATLKKEGKTVATASTFYFKEWLKIPTLSEKQSKKYFCGNQEHKWDYLDDFVRNISDSKAL
jgi:hypothetical protein